MRLHNPDIQSGMERRGCLPPAKKCVQVRVERPENPVLGRPPSRSAEHGPSMHTKADSPCRQEPEGAVAGVAGSRIR